MSLLSLRYQVRRLARKDLNVRAHSYWDKLCQALAVHKVFTIALRPAKEKQENNPPSAVLRVMGQKLERERLSGALRAAKRRLEQIVFIDEAPTQPLKLHSLDRLKTAWHSFETSAIPRIAPEKLKSAWHSIETGPIPRVTPDVLKAARHPVKAFKKARHPKMTLLTLGAIALLLITLFVQSGLAGRTLNTITTISISTAPQLAISELNTIAHRAPAINASKALARISQLSLSEYASQGEYNTWAYSACSSASMAEVFNAYGHHYRITDVLKVESTLGEITPQLGLVENTGIANTASQFGFQTTWGNNWSLDEVKRNANGGYPVIVSWPPSRYPGGHIVVVTGGDANNVYLADSSRWNRHILSNTQFMQWWAGFAALVMPA